MSVREQRYHLELQLEALEKKYRDYRKILEKQISDLSIDCLHQWNFNPDPSGNNDSYYNCTECGKESKTMRVSK